MFNSNNHTIFKKSIIRLTRIIFTIRTIRGTFNFFSSKINDTVIIQAILKARGVRLFEARDFFIQKTRVP